MDIVVFKKKIVEVGVLNEKRGWALPINTPRSVTKTNILLYMFEGAGGRIISF